MVAAILWMSRRRANRWIPLTRRSQGWLNRSNCQISWQCERQMYRLSMLPNRETSLFTFSKWTSPWEWGACTSAFATWIMTPASLMTRHTKELNNLSMPSQSRMGNTVRYRSSSIEGCSETSQLVFSTPKRVNLAAKSFAVWASFTRIWGSTRTRSPSSAATQSAAWPSTKKATCSNITSACTETVSAPSKEVPARVVRQTELLSKPSQINSKEDVPRLFRKTLWCPRGRNSVLISSNTIDGPLIIWY